MSVTSIEPVLTVELAQFIMRVNSGLYDSCTFVAGPSYVYHVPAVTSASDIDKSDAPSWLIRALIVQLVEEPLNMYWKWMCTVTSGGGWPQEGSSSFK